MGKFRRVRDAHHASPTSPHVIRSKASEVLTFFTIYVHLSKLQLV
jgi:hypothetical protein